MAAAAIEVAKPPKARSLRLESSDAESITVVVLRSPNLSGQ